MEQELTPDIRDYTEEEQSPNTRRRPRCPSCHNGLHRNWKQIEQDLENPARKQDEQEEDKDELPEK